MSIIDHILSLLAPYECLVCTAEGGLLCNICIRRLPSLSDRCYRCLRSSFGFRTCRECAPESRLYSVRAATGYSGAAKDLVWQLKSAGAQAAVEIMAARLAELLVYSPGTFIVPVPTATGRVRRRGYDQARLLARALSRQTGLPYLDCLARHGQTHQVGASREQRLRQLQDSFRATNLQAIQRAPILLVDDVVTTGATFEAAADCLVAAGAGRILAVAFAQA
jgi:ComF family protein